MDPSENLSLLSTTIATHARKIAHEEWEKEHGSFLSQILKNAGATDTLSVDGREIPVESIKKAIRDAFLQSRSKELAAKLTDQVIQSAFKKVLDEEQSL
jgi:translation elongation factor EF-G